MLFLCKYSLSSATPAVSSFEQRIRSSNFAKADSGGSVDIIKSNIFALSQATAVGN